MTKRKIKLFLILILLISLGLRLNHLNYPNSYVFDEVYHAFTAKEYLKGSQDAWAWWGTPPTGVAYEWTHPPLSKEIMASSMFILNTQDAWAWRLPGVLLGVLAIFMVFKIAQLLFKNDKVALTSAFIFSLDGLNFVQSRTGMNDIYLVFFSLTSLLFFLKKRFLISAIFFGLAFASKWSAAYLLLLYLPLLFKDRLLKKSAFFLVIPITVYLLTYIPFFLIGHNFDQFIELQKQMWWYHTSLKATHNYSSPWWSWPLNLVPVWYFVEYRSNQVANIFASGNSVLFILGSAAIFISILEYFKQKSYSLLIVILGFLIFWLPWALSPRIMFLYHFSPSVPFLSIGLSYQISTLIKNKVVFISILSAISIGFILIYPILVGTFLPKDLLSFFFLTNIAKNPF